MKFLLLLMVLASTPMIQSQDETQNVERDFGYVEEKLDESRQEQQKDIRFEIEGLN